MNNADRIYKKRALDQNRLERQARADAALDQDARIKQLRSSIKKQTSRVHSLLEARGWPGGYYCALPAKRRSMLSRLLLGRRNRAERVAVWDIGSVNLNIGHRTWKDLAAAVASDGRIIVGSMVSPYPRRGSREVLFLSGHEFDIENNSGSDIDLYEKNLKRISDGLSGLRKQVESGSI